jgi:hypothetical protein
VKWRPTCRHHVSVNDYGVLGSKLKLCFMMRLRGDSMSDRLSYVTLRYHKLFCMDVKLGLSVTERNTDCSHQCAKENI